MTGRGVAGVVFGASTLRYRQVSLPVERSTTGTIWGHSLPMVVASSVVVHGVTGCGACHRSVPTGGRANGMPRKFRVAADAAPWTTPSGVRMVSGSPATSWVAGAAPFGADEVEVPEALDAPQAANTTTQHSV